MFERSESGHGFSFIMDEDMGLYSFNVCKGKGHKGPGGRCLSEASMTHGSGIEYQSRRIKGGASWYSFHDPRVIATARQVFNNVRFAALGS